MGRGQKNPRFAGFLVVPSFMQECDWRKMFPSLLVELDLNARLCCGLCISVFNCQVTGSCVTSGLNLLSGEAGVRIAEFGRKDQGV